MNKENKLNEVGISLDSRIVQKKPQMEQINLVNADSFRERKNNRMFKLFFVLKLFIQNLFIIIVKSVKRLTGNKIDI